MNKFSPELPLEEDIEEPTQEIPKADMAWFDSPEYLDVVEKYKITQDLITEKSERAKYLKKNNPQDLKKFLEDYNRQFKLACQEASDAFEFFMANFHNYYDPFSQP